MSSSIIQPIQPAKPSPSNDKFLRAGPFERLFTGNATAKILDFLVAAQEFDYSETDIARRSGVSPRHVQREIPKLERAQLIKQTRISNARSKMYKLNTESEQGKYLEKIVLSLAKVKIPTPEQQNMNQDKQQESHRPILGAQSTQG